MRSVLSSVLAPITSIMLIMMSSGLFVSFVSLRMQLEGAGDQMIGFVQSAFFTGLLIGSIKTEVIIHRVGHIRTFAAFASLYTATILLQERVDSFWIWVPIRFVGGFGLAALFVVIESWLLDKSTMATRGRVLSIYMIALYTGQAFGQFFVDRVDLLTDDPFIIAAFISALAVFPVCVTKVDSPNVQEPIIHGVGSVFRHSPFGFMGSVLSGMILSSIYSFGPTFAYSREIPVAYFMCATILGAVLLQWVIGKISDLFDRRIVLTCTSLLTVVPALLLAWAPFPMEAVLATAFFLGGLCFTLYPISIAQVCDGLEHGAITSVTGILLLAYSAGAMMGPSVAPLLMSFFNEAGLFVYIALVASSLGAMGLYITAKYAPLPVLQQGEFIPLPPTSPVAYDLDPRVNPNDQTEIDEDVWRQTNLRGH